MDSICSDLLKTWCEGLLKLQITDIEDPLLKGGILCPACGRIHGRCFDAIYPFLYLADACGDDAYLEGAKLLFDWAEHSVSREDGSYLNDTDSGWKGTTVFSVIQLVEALSFHGHLLDPETYEKWKNRIKEAADFLCDFKEFEVCNVNYRITNSLAMELCGEFLGEERYRRRGKELIDQAVSHLTEEGLLFGEGRPVDGFSPKGCRPVDIGYSMEESLPSFVQYAYITGREDLKKLAAKALRKHMEFMLDDGGIDNSFGTRNYKWTYWGSRTSDGCGLGYLMAAEENPDFGIAAYKNLKLLKQCTAGGFLYGGPHVHDIGEPPCVHHGFSHAKVLAGILDRGLDKRLCDGEFPKNHDVRADYLKETDTYLIKGDGYRATVTGYDWEYKALPGGHASGGTLSLLWEEQAGLILCAGMCDYQMKEPANMQQPHFSNHQCITPRLEYAAGGKVYSSMYDYQSILTQSRAEEGLEEETKKGPGEETKKEMRIQVKGTLRDREQNPLEQKALEQGAEGGAGQGSYEISYVFEKRRILVEAETSLGADWILPVILGKGETASISGNQAEFQKEKTKITVRVTEGDMVPSCGQDRIYHMVPGLEAYKIVIKPKRNRIAFSISI